MPRNPTTVHQVAERHHARRDGMPDREPMARGAGDLMIVLGVAAFVLGMVMVSRGALVTLSAAHLIPTTPAALGRVERLLPARHERPAATMPSAGLVPPTPVVSTASSGGTRLVAVCTPRRALECDLRLQLMEIALQQRGLFLGRPVVPTEQDVPRKYCVLARVEESPHATPPPNDPGC